MAMLLLKPNTWIVVANGGSVRLLHNAGNASGVRLQEQDMPDLDDPHLGPSGSQPQSVDIAEATFNRKLALWLNNQALNHGFEHLVLVADPISMGELRPLLHQQVNARTQAEITKDWTNLGLKEIQKALDAIDG
ncbi:hypothetical protein ABB30_12945 [Stenotrophomonas ginsengisoli]|uniref:Attachment protein n=1 Tax=Stenotrophomonas ginsengisoli TaxID=336566 RepID=A0A0R0D1D2_9GAMM|nr:host attachment protein [Stenotrophomonas ginsengisoli]KRG75088.1 hypothetical protein ABB30_12945 [Stenotrophomonas ginsengisoli]